MTGIYFDIDDTLYSRKALLIGAAGETFLHISGMAAGADGGKKAAGSALRKAAGEDAAGEAGFPGETFLRIFYDLSDENFALVESGVITAWESNIWRFEKTFQAMGLPCPKGSGEYFAEKYTYMQNHISLSPLLENTLAGLSRGGEKSGLRLGVITNGPYDHQRHKFDMLGLGKYIPDQYLVISGQVGVSKPEEGIFKAAEKAMGLPPEKLWIVGDSLKHDIEGAKSAGWKTIWFDRSPEGKPEEAADITVHSEEELCRSLLQTFPV